MAQGPQTCEKRDMAKLRDLPDLRDLARPGTQITLRATPKAARNAITERDGVLRVSVTAAPDSGQANAAIRKLLAAAMKVPPSSLILIRGHTARDKTFCYDG